LQRTQLRDALWRALGSLPQEYREVLTLRDIAHLSDNETAQVLSRAKVVPNMRLLSSFQLTVV
jgi:DNA-directed RNA polymerase specialized sigma24 family protein